MSQEEFPQDGIRAAASMNEIRVRVREVEKLFAEQAAIGLWEFYSLTAVATNSPPMRMGTLAVLLGLHKSQAAVLVRRMERRNLLTREVSEGDRRGRDVFLTEAGRVTLDEAVQVFSGAMQRVRAGNPGSPPPEEPGGHPGGACERAPTTTSPTRRSATTREPTL
ncbi:MarR family winged helix-turn-helix transcriptional regulator [Micromonospora auratinigra]|uniref:DNA-binding transcriptional regulator, MarR family n=1 Tax=Micromonospora auratinigra TaxID=261654 RepID=A0A1A8Z438_9ACTN|nr:MarR family transcriptional regulator [Micromonospora auratinigra]SBT38689.1 DNA-binding transcriptional regulator, MarR family [Micromonospora auratinigra]